MSKKGSVGGTLSKELYLDRERMRKRKRDIVDKSKYIVLKMKVCITHKKVFSTLVEILRKGNYVQLSNWDL